jgi:acetyl-CoA C-acetyltransferase
MSKAPVILAAKRSPFGRYLGGVSRMHPLELAKTVAEAAASSRGGNLLESVDSIYVGNCLPTAFDSASSVARQISLTLGLSGFATAVDTACCAPLTALRLACDGIRAGRHKVALVMGIDMMSRVPHVVRGLRNGVRIGKVEMVDPIFPIEFVGWAPVALDAEYGADKYGVTREEMDAWSARSHARWASAQEEGRFADEVIPLQVQDRRQTATVDRDEQPRPGTTVEKLAHLKPVFGTRDITAGNAPGLNDGAVCMIVASPDAARQLALDPLGTIVAQEFATDEPRGITWVPALAIDKALAASGKALPDLQRIEINEAFAAMPLVSLKKLAEGDEQAFERMSADCNVNGGAVAIGHPVGASGLRILTTLLHELRRHDGGSGVAAICGGLSQGEAVVLEV